MPRVAHLAAISTTTMSVQRTSRMSQSTEMLCALTGSAVCGSSIVTYMQIDGWQCGASGSGSSYTTRK